MSKHIVPSDYSDRDNWLQYPETIEHDVDIIYLYPTAFMPSCEGEECTIDNGSMRSAARAIYSEQATAFEGLGNMFAPFYRQRDATELAGLSQRDMAAKEEGEPTADVYAALDHYFQKSNDGRPYVLVGHSQGSMLIMLILSNYMREHPDRYSGMIAANTVSQSGS